MYARLKMQCEDCSHIQEVKGAVGIIDNELNYWWGSSYNWCDVCDGLPHKIEEPRLFKDDNTPIILKDL